MSTDSKESSRIFLTQQLNDVEQDIETISYISDNPPETSGELLKLRELQRMGPLYDGLMHFLMSPEDLVPVLALTLLAGLRGAAHGRRALFLIPSAWLLGGLAGITTTVTNGNSFISASWFLLLGVLLAADAKLSLRLTAALAVLLGLYNGYLNGDGMGSFGTASVALLGLAFGVFVLIALAASFVVPLRANWMRIAVRVGGSWVAACGLLMLGWAARTK